MLVDEWVITLWSILNVRDMTIRDYKHLYKRHLQPLIGSKEIDLVASGDLQIKLLPLPPHTARHALIVAKTIWQEAENYGVATSNTPYWICNSMISTALNHPVFIQRPTARWVLKHSIKFAYTLFICLRHFRLSLSKFWHRF